MRLPGSWGFRLAPKARQNHLKMELTVGDPGYRLDLHEFGMRLVDGCAEELADEEVRYVIAWSRSELINGCSNALVRLHGIAPPRLGQCRSGTTRRFSASDEGPEIEMSSQFR